MRRRELLARALELASDALYSAGSRTASVADGLRYPRCTECSFVGDDGRHLPALECPGIKDGSGCARPAEHHPFTPAWWAR